MPKPEKPTAVTRHLGRTVPGWLSGLLGAFLLIFAVLMAIAAITALIAAKDGKAGSYGAAAFFGLPSVLLFAMGIRLVFQKPSSYQSVLRPLILYSLCAMFIFLGIAGCAFHLTRPTVSFIDAARGFISAALLALLCYWAGREAARKFKSAA